MRKIPTLFVRDPEDTRYLTRDVHPDCQWVIDGEGVATRKYDGTCVMCDDHARWWTRREVKPGKTPPTGFRPVETDEVTGKTVGWEPAKQSSFWKYLLEATVGTLPERAPGPAWLPGTYELVGPKINGNPEVLAWHQLVRHADAQALHDAPRDYDALRDWLHAHPYEGIVWHHPDGRMAKIKAKDFPW